MKEVTKAAKRANMKSRACKNCPIKQRLKICPPEIFEVCSAAFIEGFKKGVKAAQKAIKESNNPNVFLISGRRSIPIIENYEQNSNVFRHNGYSGTPYHNT